MELTGFKILSRKDFDYTIEFKFDDDSKETHTIHLEKKPDYNVDIDGKSILAKGAYIEDTILLNEAIQEYGEALARTVIRKPVEINEES